MRGAAKPNQRKLIVIVCMAGLVLVPGNSPGHPAHAEPVKYPFVVGFERFYTNLDTPDHLAKGGLVLLNELNCVACHNPPQQLQKALTGRIGTRLTGVGDRFEHLDLEMMIRNPRFVKTDTIMPSMFSGPDRDLEEIDALKHFLATLKEPLPKFAQGDIENGKILYHKIGCITCHAPELDYRPPWIPQNIEMNLTALPSVPMNLADRYPREAIIDLLLDPSRHRPAGRMPKFDLTEKEAIDIGTYLNSTPKPELPEQLKKALAKAQPFQPDPAKIEKGRALFAHKNCVACHSGVVEAQPIYAKPLQELTFAEPLGCLSDRPPGGGVPAYGLDILQKKAIIEALKRISETRIETPEMRLDWTLSTRNCYSCHERNGKGGPESAREIFFTVTNPDSLPNGRWAAFPPTLDGIGSKLTEAWWKRVLYHDGGSGSVRDFMALRMPVFRPEDLGEMEQIMQQLDRTDSTELSKGNAEKGLSLVAFGEKNCVACHGLGDLPPPGVPTVNLNQTTHRLREDFFTRLVKDPQSIHPEIPMPNLGLTTEDAVDIWAYLTEINAHPLPDGLLTPDVTALIPTDKPIVIRAAIEGISDDAVCVGFPNGRNAAFDVKTCSWVAQWKGRFLDPAPDWSGDESVPLKPLGQLSIIEKAFQPNHPSFLGFEIDDKGRPVFLYDSDDGLARDSLNDTWERSVVIPRENSTKKISESWSKP